MKPLQTEVMAEASLGLRLFQLPKHGSYIVRAHQCIFVILCPFQGDWQVEERLLMQTLGDVTHGKWIQVPERMCKSAAHPRIVRGWAEQRLGATGRRLRALQLRRR